MPHNENSNLGASKVTLNSKMDIIFNKLVFRITFQLFKIIHNIR